MLLVSPFFFACTEKAETIAADETADQIEKKDSADLETAALEGRNAAKEIVTKNWSDTMAMQKAVLEVRAKSSRYEMAGEEKSKAAFDTAFFNTLRTVRPDLVKALDPKAK